MIPSWTNDWVGVPYSEVGRGPDSYDCLGLYLKLNEVRQGVIIPDPRCTIPSAIRDDVYGKSLGEYSEVSHPEEGDAILIRSRGHPLHVGYYINPQYMIHCESGIGTTVDRWNGPVWKNRVIGIYRYDNRL